MVPESQRNPVKDLPPDEGAFDTYKKYGYMMFPQQRKIYENIKDRIISHATVVEVGCGIGLGTALLDRSLTTKVMGTDNLIENVKMARALYPWLKFEQWDALQPYPLSQRPDVIVGVEVLEHVSDPALTLHNLCATALKEVWLSTPNGIGKKRPPSNPYHVCEYIPNEILTMLREIPGDWDMEVLAFDSFNRESLTSRIDPLVYHLTKGK